MANRKGIKYLWGPFRALLRKMSQRDKVLVLSLVTGILCGLAAVLLKQSIHWISTGLDTLFQGNRWPWLFVPVIGMLIYFSEKTGDVVMRMRYNGEKFDPKVHMAVQMMAVEGMESDHVAEVIKKGYTMNDKVIRPAMVIVSQ